MRALSLSFPRHTGPPVISIEALKERKLVQWFIAYAAGAWVLLEVLALLGDAFAWPPLMLRWATVFLACGIPFVLVLAWYHGEKGAQRVSGVEIAMLAGILVIAGALLSRVAVDGQAGVAGEASEAPASRDASDILPAAVVVPEQNSIAVLPFVNMSSDPEQEFFSDGITEELLNVLAQLPELRVAARTSSFAFKGDEVGIDSIARALNVRHVLEGSVRKSENRVRITAQLIDADNGFHMWSESYDRDLDDVFAVQDEITQAIVSQLRLRLPGSNGPLAKVETADAEAHTLLLKALQVARPATGDALEQAGALLEQAIERDPEYARAHATLAFNREAQVYYKYVPSADGLADARSAAERALELDPEEFRAHFMLGTFASEYDWDWAAAERSFARAMEINPSATIVHSLPWFLLMRLGRTEEALASADRAIELDPVSAKILGNAATLYWMAGQPERARQMFEESIQLFPGSPVQHANFSYLHSQQGRHEDAIRTARKSRDLAPEYSGAVTALAYALARSGDQAGAEVELRTLQEMPQVSPYLLAGVHAAMGRREQVLDLLERAIDERDNLVLDLGWDQVFAEYRDEPRVRAILERIGLS